MMSLLVLIQYRVTFVLCQAAMKNRPVTEFIQNSLRFWTPVVYFYGINRIGFTRDHRNLSKFRLAATKYDL